MIEIIPAIDIIDGRCVRLTQGDYNQKRDYGIIPLDMALRYEAMGIHRLHIVDLDGAKADRSLNLDSVRAICQQTSLRVQFGGGIKSREAIEMAFEAGVHTVICGSIAVTEPEKFSQWLREFGGDRVTLGADIKDGKIAINGWLESGDVGVEQIIDRFARDGLKRVVCTDISKDGMLEGPNFELYKTLQERYPQIEIVVSGGISSIEDLDRLRQLDLRAVIVGKAIYEGRITLNKLERWLQNE
ncbi:MAG: 1-(5-phosphoribosyl)-5-[(5-phosphoribosylamino)methylideneamino]imidazole-4-carboxamide isomerase [Rikenellaceae bacterium]